MTDDNDILGSWWRRLSDAEQRELLTAWDEERGDDRIVLLRSTACDSRAGGGSTDGLENEMWTEQLREWITNHDEIVFHLSTFAERIAMLGRFFDWA